MKRQIQFVAYCLCQEGHVLASRKTMNPSIDLFKPMVLVQPFLTHDLPRRPGWQLVT